MRVANTFLNGDKAQKFLEKDYFASLSLDTEPIKPRSKLTSPGKFERTPEGYILENGKKIALYEIKCISFRDRQKNDKNDFEIIETDNPIRRNLKKAISQLGSVSTDLPKIVYLTTNEPFFDPSDVRFGIWGRWHTTINTKGERIFDGHRGFTDEFKHENIFTGNIITAVICFIPMLVTDEYKLWIYINENCPKLPIRLHDEKHIDELWKYRDLGGRVKICKDKNYPLE